ncbi:hypothetical protein [Idiomarina sp.]|uniref:hypothetical protein n=1 Tax=Idiomarina sp. TaxID=1874361 RepID=UPI001D6EBE1B|nr:hypothetical protein [Idiomarina sp.]MCJ8317705.1 hypothetical protein [Idiomarina sp.]NQZ17265.1 hypothetical protein [Idiomarina sp.]
MTVVRFGLFLMITSLITGCGQNERAAAEGQQKQPVTELTKASDLKELELEVRRMVKTPAADNPEQCKIVEMGQKPCGGPERYLLYSEKTMNADEREVFLEKLKQYNELSRRFSEKSEMVSDCKVLPKPTAVLQKGFCIPAEQNTM